MPIVYICRACGERFDSMRGLQVHAYLTVDTTHRVETERLKSPDGARVIYQEPKRDMTPLPNDEAGSVSKPADAPQPTQPVIKLSPEQEAEKLRRELRGM